MSGDQTGWIQNDNYSYQPIRFYELFIYLPAVFSESYMLFDMFCLAVESRDLSQATVLLNWHTYSSVPNRRVG